MRPSGWIVFGVVWGVVGVAVMDLLGNNPPEMMSGLASSSPTSFIVELFTFDNLNHPVLRFLFTPLAVGVDVLIWTLGLVAWLIVGRSWPGSALGALLSPYPVLSWIIVLLFSALPGAGISWVFGRFWRYFTTTFDPLDK